MIRLKPSKINGLRELMEREMERKMDNILLNPQS